MTNFSTEIWKDIPGYEGLYQASNLGRIKSLNHSTVQKCKNNKRIFHQYKGRILKGWVQNTGYLTVSLKNKKYSVHRIIALTFLQKEKGKNIVNHIDGNKLNNNINNLEWCNYKHNFDEALRLNLINIKYNSYQNRIRAKKINQYDLQGNFIKSYSCSVDAEKELKEKGVKINSRNIRNVCNGKRNKAGNYVWKYAD
jgi:hypothetical protein